MEILSQGLRTTVYRVDDLKAAKAWYSEAFCIAPFFDEDIYVGYYIGGYEMRLVPKKVSKPQAANILSYWSVGDITDTYDKMVSSGAKELEAPNELSEGIKVALLKDPWKNVLGLIHYPLCRGSTTDHGMIERMPFELINEASIDSLIDAS